MMCITDGVLRARLDGELGQNERLEVDQHLLSCASCRRRAEATASQAQSVGKLLSALAPVADETPADAGIAFARLQAQIGSSEVGASSWLSRVVGSLFSRRFAPAWGAAAALALVTVFLSFAPARSWGQKILAMLRVQKIEVVSVNPEVIPGLNGDNRTGKMIGQMLSDNVVVTLSPGQPQIVATADEASQLAGFRVRVLSGRSDAPRFNVEGEQAFHMTVDRDRLQAILEEAGRPDLRLPPSLNGATIAVHIPRVVVSSYGCPKLQNRDAANPGAKGGTPQDRVPVSGDNCVVLAQAPSPTVSVPPDLNLAQIAEAALQVAGMSAEEARAFCQTVDWTSTLVVPLPRDVSSYQKVDVDSVQGTLIDMPPRGRRRVGGYSLLWVKNGIIYSLMGHGDSADAVTLAASLD